MDQMRADVARITAAPVARGIAAVGVLLIAALPALGFLFCVAYWPELIPSVLLVAGTGRLLLFRRWEGLAVGACCWAFLGIGVCRLVFPVAAIASRLTESILAALLPLAVGITIAANVWALVKWLWNLPVPRLLAAGVLCSLSLELAATVRPYWVARFRGREADRRHAMLIAAPLDAANLSGADLSGADLREASLCGANLVGADLRGAALSGVMYDDETRWPNGFDPGAQGARGDPCAF